MKIKDIIVLSGTHGNEINGVFFAENLAKIFIQHKGKMNVHRYIVNKDALKHEIRFVDEDINRMNNKTDVKNSEGDSLRKFHLFCEKFDAETTFIIDLHTTSADMGVCLVNSRSHLSIDLFLGKMVHLNPHLKIIETEKINHDASFINNFFKYGVIIEIGPCATNTLSEIALKQFNLCFNHIFQTIEDFNHQIVAKREYRYDIFKEASHIKYPTKNDVISHYPSKELQNFKIVEVGQKIFSNPSGDDIYNTATSFYPIFIGESGYYHERICYIKTERLEKNIFG